MVKEVFKECHHVIRELYTNFGLLSLSNMSRILISMVLKNFFDVRRIFFDYIFFTKAYFIDLALGIPFEVLIALLLIILTLSILFYFYMIANYFNGNPRMQEREQTALDIVLVLPEARGEYPRP